MLNHSLINTGEKEYLSCGRASWDFPDGSSKICRLVYDVDSNELMLLDVLDQKSHAWRESSTIERVQMAALITARVIEFPEAYNLIRTHITPAWISLRSENMGVPEARPSTDNVVSVSAEVFASLVRAADAASSVFDAMLSNGDELTREERAAHTICLDALGALTEEQKAYLNIQSPDSVVYDLDPVRVEVAHIGEGYGGDYDPSDPDDERLLRFTVFRKGENQQFEPVEGGAYCTTLSTSISRKEKLALGKYIAETVRPKILANEPINKLCARLSGINRATIAPLEDDDTSICAPSM